MSKIMKTVALLFVIAAVVFVAGCASQQTSTNTTGAQEQVTPKTSIASEGGNQSETSVVVPPSSTVTGANNETGVNQTDANLSINSDNGSPSDGSNGRVSQELIRRDKERDALNLSDNNTYENNTTV